MIEHLPPVRHEFAVRSLQVVRTAALSPAFRRITLGGKQLSGFSSVGPADHVKVILEDGGAEARRDYTPRQFRAADGDTEAELDIDVFLHGDGVASTWAVNAEVGDGLTVAGPRGSTPVPSGIRRVILGADETAMPALARWIEILDDDIEIFAFIELNDPSDAAYLEPTHVHRARVVWLDTAENAMERAVRALGPVDENTYVWMAGEATRLIPVRRYLRRELALPATQVKIVGYWKQGEEGRDHHAPVDPSDPD